MYYIVYKTTNIINGKIYVGCHKTENIDDGYIGTGVVFSQAVKKYGKESFVRKVLELCDTQESMLEKESKIVDEGFINRGDTYNLIKGGTGVYHTHNSIETRQKISDTRKRKIKSGEIILGMQGRKHSEETKRKMSKVAKGLLKSEETKKKISESLKGNRLSEQTRKKISISQQGRIGGMKDKKHSEETKKKMSVAQTGRKHSEETKRKISETKRMKNNVTI
jgi:group I intron endonuclease